MRSLLVGLIFGGVSLAAGLPNTGFSILDASVSASVVTPAESLSLVPNDAPREQEPETFTVLSQILTPFFSSPVTAGCTMPSTAGFAGIWEADLGATCTGGCTNGNPVTALADQGPLGNTLTAGTAGTLLTGQVNGLPVINMDGATTVYTSAIQWQAGSLSVLMVGRQNNTTNKGVVTSDTAGAGSFAYYYPYTSSNLEGADADLTGAIGGGTAVPDMLYHVTDVVWTDGVSAVFRKDGAADGTVLSGTSAGNQGGQIGKDVAGTSGQWGNYRWFFIAVYNGVASGTIVSNWEAYLRCKTLIF